MFFMTSSRSPSSGFEALEVPPAQQQINSHSYHAHQFTDTLGNSFENGNQSFNYGQNMLAKHYSLNIHSNHIKTNSHELILTFHIGTDLFILNHAKTPGSLEF